MMEPVHYVTLPLIPPTGDRWANWPWWRKGKERKRWRDIVAVLWCLQAHCARNHGRRVKLGIRIWRRRVVRDDDNLYAGLKPLLDALKRAGVIVDDSREWLMLVPPPEQIVAKTGQRECTELRLEVLE